MLLLCLNILKLNFYHVGVGVPIKTLLPAELLLWAHYATKNEQTLKEKEKLLFSFR